MIQLRTDLIHSTRPFSSGRFFVRPPPSPVHVPGMSQEEYADYMPVQFSHNQKVELLVAPPENPSVMRQKYPDLYLNLLVPPPLTPLQKFTALMGDRNTQDLQYRRQMYKFASAFQAMLFQMEIRASDAADHGMTMMQTPYQSDPINPPQQGSWVWMPGASDPAMTTMVDAHSQHRFDP